MRGMGIADGGDFDCAQSFLRPFRGAKAWQRPSCDLRRQPANEVLEPLPGACLLAQALTLAIVLFRSRKGESRLGVVLDECSASMPGYIPLRREYGDGRVAHGAIFVLLDEIWLIASDSQLRDEWAVRIERNEKLCGVVCKVTHCGVIRQTCVDCDLCSRSGSTAGCVAAEGTTFAGVTFLPGGQYAPATPLEAMPASRRAKHTWRGLAAILGTLLWQVRVYSAGVHPDKAPMLLVREEHLLQLWHAVEEADADQRAGIARQGRTAAGGHFCRPSSKERRLSARIHRVSCGRCVEIASEAVNSELAMPCQGSSAG